MKTATPQSLPEGVKLSAGIRVSTAAFMKAASVAFSVSQTSGFGAEGVVPPVGAGAASAVGARPVPANAATAPPAAPAPAPLRNSRRGSFTSAISPSQKWQKRHLQ